MFKKYFRCGPVCRDVVLLHDRQMLHLIETTNVHCLTATQQKLVTAEVRLQNVVQII